MPEQPSIENVVHPDIQFDIHLNYLIIIRHDSSPPQVLDTFIRLSPRFYRHLDQQLVSNGVNSSVSMVVVITASIEI